MNKIATYAVTGVLWAAWLLWLWLWLFSENDWSLAFITQQFAGNPGGGVANPGGGAANPWGGSVTALPNQLAAWTQVFNFVMANPANNPSPTTANFVLPCKFGTAFVVPPPKAPARIAYDQLTTIANFQNTACAVVKYTQVANALAPNNPTIVKTVVTLPLFNTVGAKLPIATQPGLGAWDYKLVCLAKALPNAAGVATNGLPGARKLAKYCESPINPVPAPGQPVIPAYHVVW